MTKYTQNLMVGNLPVSRDPEGRFSLNDLHRAAGGEARQRPNYWIENQQTKELIAELEIAGIPAISAKPKVGTFVCKELVYAYAMWVSPKFHLAVIRAYDDIVAGNVSVPMERQLQVLNREFKAAMGIAKTIGLKGNQATLAADRAVSATLGVSALRLVGHEAVETDERPLTATELGRECDLNGREMNELLSDCGYQAGKRDGKGRRYWVPTSIAEPFAVLLDTNKKHGDGTPVTQLKWKPSILKHLANHLESRVVA